VNTKTSRRLAGVVATIGLLGLAPTAAAGGAGICPDRAAKRCPGVGASTTEAERTRVRPLPASAKGPRGGEMWRSGKWLME